jgi:hypothetical protein
MDRHRDAVFALPERKIRTSNCFKLAGKSSRSVAGRYNGMPRVMGSVVQNIRIGKRSHVKKHEAQDPSKRRCRNALGWGQREHCRIGFRCEHDNLRVAQNQNPAPVEMHRAKWQVSWLAARMAFSPSRTYPVDLKKPCRNTVAGSARLKAPCLGPLRPVPF